MPVSPVTIGRTHASGHGLIAHCLDCQRGHTLDLPKLIARYGGDCPPKALPLKCSRCGSRRFSVTVYALDGRRVRCRRRRDKNVLAGAR